MIVEGGPEDDKPISRDNWFTDPLRENGRRERGRRLKRGKGAITKYISLFFRDLFPGKLLRLMNLTRYFLMFLGGIFKIEFLEKSRASFYLTIKTVLLNEETQCYPSYWPCQ